MRIRSFIAFVLLAACRSSTEPVPGDLAQQQALWLQQGLKNYDYEFSWASEWFPRTDARIIQVRNGLVASVMTAAGDTIDTSQWYPSPPTMDSLFARALRFRDEGDGAVVEATFDPALHYPRYLSLDHTGWADDAVWLFAEKLIAR